MVYDSNIFEVAAAHVAVAFLMQNMYFWFQKKYTE